MCVVVVVACVSQLEFWYGVCSSSSIHSIKLCWTLFFFLFFLLYSYKDICIFVIITWLSQWTPLYFYFLIYWSLHAQNTKIKNSQNSKTLSMHTIFNSFLCSTFHWSKPSEKWRLSIKKNVFFCETSRIKITLYFAQKNT